MNRLMKKLLALLLCLALCLSMLPASLAEEPTDESAEEDLIVIVEEDPQILSPGEAEEEQVRGDVEDPKEDVNNPASEVTLDSEHFPDNNFRAYVEENIDDGDGVLSAEECAAVDTIEVCGTNIASLKGIEYFTELRVLNFWSDWEMGPLSQVDLSHNTKLEDLTLGFSELTELDVSMLPNLRTLMVGYTGLSELDLTHNPELIQLICNDSKFTNLDLSGNQKLKILDCCGNEGLYSLDISHNPELVSVYRAGGRHVGWMQDISQELYNSVIVYGGEGEHDYTMAVNTWTSVFDEEGEEITVWVSDSVADQTRERIRTFNATHELEKPINARVEPIGEGEIFDFVMADPGNAADLFGFPQDQLVNFARAGALDPLSEAAVTTVTAENAESAVASAVYGDRLYAYPMTADNGYFMYYDKSVIPEEHLGSLEAILADCESAGKSFCFELNSGWYLVSFFFGTGCVSEWTPNGVGWNYTDNLNSPDGLIAAQGVKTLASSQAFMDCSDGVAAFEECNAAVVVSGVWDYYNLLDILGENLGAAELPSFTVDGTLYHMASFMGCKLLGVKPQQDEARAALLHELAAFLNNEDSQLERFECAAWGPSNLNAQSDPDVQAQPALAALLRQNRYAVLQGVIPGYWWAVATTLSIDLRNAENSAEQRTALLKYELSLPTGKLPYPAVGVCGDDLTWTLDEDGLLTVSGTGDMWDFELDRENKSTASWSAWEQEIKSLVLEKGVASVGEEAFDGCRNLSSVSFSDTVSYIGPFAFQNTALVSVEIPAALTEIADCAFYRNLNMLEFLVDAENPNYCSMDGVLFNKNMTVVLQYPCGVEGEYTLPDSVTAVGNDAFGWCVGLTKLTLPDGLTRIGNRAFGECINLESINLPSGLEEICLYAFIECNSLTSVTIPDSVTTIGEYAFSYCKSLTEIRFEGSAPQIKDGFFYGTTAMAYYPADDENWTEEVRQDYGGKITWIPCVDEKPVNDFSDVKEGKYYCTPVLWAYYHDPQITGGVDAAHFGPNQTCTRAQIVTFLWKASGAPEPVTTENPFSDVKEGKYYYKAVLWAVENGITSGVGDGKFGVNSPCTREQAMTFLWKACGSPEPTNTNNPFTDVKSGKYYFKPILWAVENGITSGVSADQFGVGQTCTRAQIVTFLYKAMG